MKFEIGQLLGNYRIIRPLGKGGMGEVYEVEHVRLGVRYALKAFVLAHGHVDLLRERFVAEGKILARLNHPNLVRVFEMDFDAASNSLYFVMDLVVGEAGLAKCLDEIEIGSVDEGTAAKWFCQLCSALDYIHSQGIVHRDIKPSNILVAADGSVRLVDFGVSRYVTDELRRTLALEQRQVDGEWRSGTFNVKMGTGDYMAPEVKRGGEATAASDAYSLGLVFFHLLTGMWYAPRRKMLDMLDPFEKPWKDALGLLLRGNAKERAEELSPLAARFLSDGNKNPIRHSRRPI